MAPSLPERAGRGAWKIAKMKRPARTIVIDTDEHLSYYDLAAVLSGVRSMHRSSDTIAPG
jgi:hypothetical protein